MFHIRKSVNIVLSILMILSMALSLGRPQTASAQGEDRIKRQVNAETGKVSFIGPESGRSLSASQTLGILPGNARLADPAMALAKRFGPEFGLRDAFKELSVIHKNHQENGRVTVRYQQNYHGIPIMGGELIVNTNDKGDLFSMNGEVSTDLSLPSQPTIDSEQARQIALQGMAKWYEKSPADFSASEPELWVFDESLLRPSDRPVELVWRMEVTPVDDNMPVRELALINAQSGNISLHFNQIDTAWHSSESASTIQSSEVVAPISSSTKPEASHDASSNKTSSNDLSALAATTWYVATTGSDSNSCSAPASPCATIQGAIGKAANGDTIKVATGTYTSTSRHKRFTS